MARLLLAAWLTLVLLSCVRERPSLAAGPGSFKVELTAIDPFTKTGACAEAPDTGTADCPRPFADTRTPTRMRLTVTALDKKAQPLTSYAGIAVLDVRPGQLAVEVAAGQWGVPPAGLTARFAAGVAEVDVAIMHAFGATRVWVEDCGTSAERGSFATGVSPELFFVGPRVDQVNYTTDNTTSPLIPRFTNVCAIAGDPRYGLGTNEDGATDFVGWSHGRAVNAPPPAMGNYLEMSGCSAAEHDASIASGGCERGPLVVTGIGNEGFFFTDVSPAAQARGFASMYVFNFNYPDNLEVGDVLLWVRGTPVEFTGSTQVGNPTWRRDPGGKRLDLVPKPVKISPTLYRDSLRTYGRNRPEALELEKLESAVVCMDNLAPARELRDCDSNASASIERQGCLVDAAAPLPPRCETGVFAAVPQPPACDAASARSFCMPLSEADLTACGLTGFIPENPAEYCCERLCYDDLACSEASSFVSYGQWSADVFGRYVPDDSPSVKISLITRDAGPDFYPELTAKDAAEQGIDESSPFQFAAAQAASGTPKRVRVIGNLRQVLAARPVWVIIARGPSDIAVDKTCP